MTESGPRDKGVTVLFRQDGALVVDKPRGLSTTGRTLTDEDCLQHALEQQEGARLWAVHQLDRGTSGVVVFVTKKSLVPGWQARLREPATKKDYLAVVRGEPDWPKKLLDRALRWDARAKRQRAAADGKASRTLARVVAKHAGYALVEARLLTGRTHQVRTHLAHAGFPLVGDRTYGDDDGELFAWPALHAERLRFLSDDGKRQERLIEAPLPEDLRALLTRLGLSR